MLGEIRAIPDLQIFVLKRLLRVMLFLIFDIAFWNVRH